MKKRFFKTKLKSCVVLYEKRSCSIIEPSEDTLTPTKSPTVRPTDTHKCMHAHNQFFSRVMFNNHLEMSARCVIFLFIYFEEMAGDSVVQANLWKYVIKTEKIPIVEIILSSRRPPRHRNSASLLKCFGEFLKLSPVAVPEKQSPFMLSNPVLASFSIIFPLFLAFHSQSLMTSVLWRPQPPCLPSSGVVYHRSRRKVHFW